MTVIGENDFEIDSDIACTIVCDPASSADLDYNGLDVDDVSVTNLGDDDLSQPSVSCLPDQTFDQDHLPTGDPIDLWAYAADDETPDSGLTFTIESSPPPSAGITLTDGCYLNVDPSFDWCGYYYVSVRVTDHGGLWDEDTLRVAVTWVCKGPLPVANQQTQQYQPITLNLTTHEPQINDGTGMYWYVTGQEHCTVSGEYSEDDVLIFTPHLSFLGSDAGADPDLERHRNANARIRELLASGYGRLLILV